MVLLVPFQLTGRGTNEKTQRSLILHAGKNLKQQIYVEVIKTVFEINDKYLTVIGNIVDRNYMDSYFQVVG